MNTQELIDKIKKLKELKAMAEELQADITGVENDIKAEMTARNTYEMQVDIFKVKWNTVKFKHFDTQAFKSTHKELYDQYTKVKESRRFTVC